MVYVTGDMHGDPLRQSDPYGGTLETYRMCRDVLAAAVEELVARYED